jgi:hypothetical protein
MKGANIQNQMDIRTQKTLLLAALTTPQLIVQYTQPSDQQSLLDKERHDRVSAAGDVPHSSLLE